ncbi:glycoside hydrolase family 3 protein [Butyrivibrio sp. MC2013]|uniref:glycoside hydrolase family 3 protein n=1 Tax=Butyrivibrio sp. MC2013 TaxID=1280686 RepID=UPI0003F52D05|nr:glycoside hydrolase family 3 protein [Butyrivibrio sp. MC2013]
MTKDKLGIPMEGLADLARKAAAEGAVLLRNTDKVLPLRGGESVAVFGRCQIEYYRSGTGSGGAVNVEYTTNLLDSLKDNPAVSVDEKLEKVYRDWLIDNPFDNGGGGWAAEPWSQQEMPVSRQLAEDAAKRSHKAVIVIGRTAGEDKDNTYAKGAFLLSDTEQELIDNVSEAFGDVIIVLNVSNVIDMSFVDKAARPSSIKAILYAWQGGMEGGRGAADVLTGLVPAQGKLSDTIAYNISDYPSDKSFGGELSNIYQDDIYVGYRYFETFNKKAVRYPFGFGLSYTEFEIKSADCFFNKDSEEFVVKANVKNIGDYKGKEVVQIYIEGPQTGIGRPSRVLAGFTKTRLLEAGEEEDITITVPLINLAVFDDSGKSGFKNAYVIEAGDHFFHLGNSVRDTSVIKVDGSDSYKVDQTYALVQCEEALAPVTAFKRMVVGQPIEDGSYQEAYEDAPLRETDLAARIKDRLPKDLEITGNKGLTLKMVKDGKCSMEDFIAQLSVNDLATIARGEGMCSIKVTPGTASCFGGVSDRLLEFGIPLGCCSDGPSGIRMDGGLKATQMPIGTLLACTFDIELIEEAFTLLGKEMVRNRIDTLLGPGMNIHRHPLCGRNFEYFSEDPLLTGKMAAAIVRGIGKNGVFATIKHFACNSQEYNRHKVEAVLSQRALREIYLKGFEIAVREGGARSVMTSYNPVNGYWAASNYDLTTTLLRKEWGFKGLVMSDWWATMNDVITGGSEADHSRTGDMIRAQNDVYMVVNNNGAEINAFGDDTMEALDAGRLTIGELQRGAMNLCGVLMDMPAFDHLQEMELKIPEFEGADAADGHIGPVLQKSPRIMLDKEQDIWFFNEEDARFGVVSNLTFKSSDRAQTVCQALINGEELVTFQTNGTDGRWIRQKLLTVILKRGWYHLQLRFPKPGMEVEYLEFLEEKD